MKCSQDYTILLPNSSSFILETTITQSCAIKLWLWLVLLLSGSSLLVKDGDKQNFKVHITSLLHVASSKSRDEVFLQVAF